MAFSCLILTGSVPFGTSQSGTSVSGIIDSSTTWTQANSPYELTGNVLVDYGATLTIESDVIVNFNAYYMRVNGTLTVQSGATINFASLVGTPNISNDNIQVNGLLVAVGTSANPIHVNGFFGSSIHFSQSSKSWDEQQGSGCIIQNSIINSTSISAENSVKIDKNTITGNVLAHGIISNNNILGSLISHSPVVISNNVITGLASGWNSIVVVYVQRDPSDNGPLTFSNNTIYGGTSGIGQDPNMGIDCGGDAIISDNVISGCGTAIRASSGIIQRNYIHDNNAGVFVENAIVENNTFVNDDTGVAVHSSATVIYNNFENDLGIYASTTDVDASNNWWGTTDTTGIENKIYDFNDDFSLGKVNYVPFLTAPNPYAMPDPNAPIETPTPSSSPPPEATQTPNTTSTPPPQSPDNSGSLFSLTAEQTTIVVMATVIAVLAITVAALWRKKA
jgi:hypothetical protein